MPIVTVATRKYKYGGCEDGRDYVCTFIHARENQGAIEGLYKDGQMNDFAQTPWLHSCVESEEAWRGVAVATRASSVRVRVCEWDDGGEVGTGCEMTTRRST